MPNNAVINPAMLQETSTGKNKVFTPSEVNWYRIIAVAERLYAHIYNKDINDSFEFFNLCLSLARGIDYAVANSEVPSFGHKLTRLLKQVCLRKNDFLLQPAIMVLMISVKTACKNGWFSHTDSEELQTLVYEIGSAFCSAKDINTEATSLDPTISLIISRFYPQMKIDHILAFLTAKPGFEAYVMDFQILKNINSFPEDKIFLFVAQIDNLDTSACLISPQKVNFLLNGTGVDRRSNVFMDNGPQLPTNVTKLLKYGTNLLQAVGEFNGNYVIIVAYMCVVTPPVCPSFQDYVRPAVALPDSDPELVEGPSRIALNCPISMKRIKTPVKGHSCNHYQCFDLDNYVDINARRPSWRCPHCNQSVCFNDIRIDQNMVKILKEVGETVDDVMISADGSWKVATERKDRQHHETSNCVPDVLPQQEPSCTATGLHDIMDLTEVDEVMATVGACEKECIKPLLAASQDQFSSLHTANTGVVNQSTATLIEDTFWSGVYLPMHGPSSSGDRIDTQTTGIWGSAPSNYMFSPVFTDAVPPSVAQEPENLHAPVFATSVASSRTAAPVNIQLQQYGSSDMMNECGRFPSASYTLYGIPVAVQSHHAQVSTSVSQQRPSNTPHMSPYPSVINGSAPVFSNVERQQQLKSHLSSLQGPYMSSSLEQQIGSWGPQGHLFRPVSPSVVITTPPAPIQHPGGYQVSAAHNTDGQNLHQQQSTAQRLSHVKSQSPSLARSPSHSPMTQTHQGCVPDKLNPALVGQQHEQYRSAAEITSYVARMRSQPHSVQVNTSPVLGNVNTHGPLSSNTVGTVQPVTSPEGFADLAAAEQDWRPTGRMRGSLSGQAYSAALNQYIVQPTQPVQLTRPWTNTITPLYGISSSLHNLRTNNMNFDALLRK